MKENKPMIRLQDITMAYEKEAVLEDFSITIEKGEFITIIGSSGCGKTTVLKLINGLLVPRKGSVWIDGHDIEKSDIIALRRKIGYVIQEAGLFPHMSVRKNISYVTDLEKQKPNKDWTNRRIEELLSMICLEKEVLERYPRELSGGQRQRVGLARALMAKPDILLMDEPFGAIDAITRRKLQKEILDIYQKMKCTIVFITHDIQEALLLGTRVIVMDKGNIVQQGSAEELRKTPVNEFVSELVKA